MPTLDWLSKESALKAAQQTPYRLLEHDAGLSYGDPDSGNLLVQGDNLEALKALMPLYGGQVKCIYIDPPYNTKSAFEHYDDNLEHSQWLSLMYPRLELLHDLLAEDGSIWVSIDDNEVDYLKVLMDDVFGRSNFICKVIWQKIYSPKNSAKHFSVDHDYIVVYAKNAERWHPNPMPRTDKQNKAYKNPDDDPRGLWKAGDFSARNFYSLGTYPITCPSGRTIEGPPPGTYWRYSKAKLLELDADNRIWWGKDGNNSPAIKRFLTEVKQGRVPQTFWPYEEVGHTQDAKKEMVALFHKDIFGTPKPEKLIQRVLQVGSNSGDLILDSFLGSGTTAAVAHKMGRRYIGVEMGDHAVTHCIPRLKKVVDGEQGGISKSVEWQGGGGFRFYRLGENVYDEYGRLNEKITFAALAGHIWLNETEQPIPATNREPSPLLGIHKGVAYYLLYNGNLGDKCPNGGNVLTTIVLKSLPPHAGPKVIYGETSRLGPERLAMENISFKQIPYDVKAH